MKGIKSSMKLDFLHFINLQSLISPNFLIVFLSVRAELGIIIRWMPIVPRPLCSGLGQRGKEEEGIRGFLSADIRKLE